MSGVIRNVSKNQVITPPLKPTQYSGEPGGRGLGGKWEMGDAGRNGYIHGAFLPPLSLGKEKEERKRRIKNGMAFFLHFSAENIYNPFSSFHCPFS